MEKENQNIVRLEGKLVELRKVWMSADNIVREGIIQINRDSGSADYLPVLFLNLDLAINSIVSIEGQFRSRDVDNNGKLKVELYVYAKKVEVLAESNCNINDVQLTGYVCKRPTLRTTPSGKQISDLLIACNFNKDKTAYIPVIAWGKSARKAGKYAIGTEIKVSGRMQSRKYTKLVDDILKEFTAYELSANSLDEIINII